jgi:hypothetical protein
MMQGNQESIYNLIPPEVYVPPKPARYKSTHEGKVDAKKLSYSTFVVPKKSKGTFGPEGRLYFYLYILF